MYPCMLTQALEEAATATEIHSPSTAVIMQLPEVGKAPAVAYRVRNSAMHGSRKCTSQGVIHLRAALLRAARSASSALGQIRACQAS